MLSLFISEFIRYNISHSEVWSRDWPLLDGRVINVYVSDLNFNISITCYQGFQYASISFSSQMHVT